jgi:hypothetical protein
MDGHGFFGHPKCELRAVVEHVDAAAFDSHSSGEEQASCFAINSAAHRSHGRNLIEAIQYGLRILQRGV